MNYKAIRKNFENTYHGPRKLPILRYCVEKENEFVAGNSSTLRKYYAG